MRCMNSSADLGKISTLPEFQNCFCDMRNVSMFSVIKWKNNFQNQFVNKICSNSVSFVAREKKYRNLLSEHPSYVINFTGITTVFFLNLALILSKI